MEKKNIHPDDKKGKMTRKQAIAKAGKYAAFTAVSMMLILDPAVSSAKKDSIVKPRP